MKKWLLLIILGFALTSIFAISYTNQVIGNFTGFDEDDENGDEVSAVFGNNVYDSKIASQKSLTTLTSLINKKTSDNPFINYNLLS